MRIIHALAALPAIQNHRAPVRRVWRFVLLPRRSIGESPPSSVGALLYPLLRSRAFLIVCALSLGCTIIRETFNIWTPLYLKDYLGYSTSKAAGMSAVFPSVGAVSVLASGWLSDRLGANGRSILLFVGLSATAAALLYLTRDSAYSTAALLRRPQSGDLP